MKKILSIFPLIFILESCANKVISNPNDIPPPPPKVESVIPHVISVDNKLDKLKDSNVQLEEKIKNQNKTILDQKMALQNAITQAEKLKNKILSDESLQELDALSIIDQLNQAGVRNLFLEKQNEELEKIRKGQDILLSDTKNKLNDTLTQLTLKETEASNLRLQNEYLSERSKKNQDNIKTLNEQLDRANIKASTASVYKRWVITIVVIAIAWIILKNLLMIYFPAIKFRI